MSICPYLSFSILLPSPLLVLREPTAAWYSIVKICLYNVCISVCLSVCLYVAFSFLIVLYLSHFPFCPLGTSQHQLHTTLKLKSMYLCLYNVFICVCLYVSLSLSIVLYLSPCPLCWSSGKWEPLYTSCMVYSIVKICSGFLFVSLSFSIFLSVFFSIFPRNYSSSSA